MIFWSFIGYENTSNVAEEFENPKKDFHRSIVLSVLLVSFLQIAVAFVTIGTHAYEAGGSVAPFAVILSNVMGRYAGEGTALVAVFIIFGTVNAYTTGLSRLLYAVARDGGLPRALAHINPKTGGPGQDSDCSRQHVCRGTCHILFFADRFSDSTLGPKRVIHSSLRSGLSCRSDATWPTEAGRNELLPSIGVFGYFPDSSSIHWPATCAEPRSCRRGSSLHLLGQANCLDFEPECRCERFDSSKIVKKLDALLR